MEPGSLPELRQNSRSGESNSEFLRLSTGEENFREGWGDPQRVPSECPADNDQSLCMIKFQGWGRSHQRGADGLIHVEKGWEQFLFYHFSSKDLLIPGQKTESSERC